MAGRQGMKREDIHKAFLFAYLRGLRVVLSMEDGYI